MAASNLSGRTALVTGASSGIGEATAKALAQAGVKVAIAARRRDRLDKLAHEMGGAEVIEADLSDPDAAQAMVRTAEARLGNLDILVNNAGVMYIEPIAEADLGRWHKMLELNVLGLIAATQAALAGMRARKTGHIVNVASTAGRFPSANAAGYNASKFGVVGFSEALRQEVYADNIRVTVIEPGVVETELRDHIAHQKSQTAINKWADSMRQLQSEDISDAILYAVSRPDHVNVNEILIRPTDQER